MSGFAKTSPTIDEVDGRNGSQLLGDDHNRLFEKLLKSARHSFDAKSKTHIFFCIVSPGLAPRGIGEYPDGAFVDFRQHAFELVEKLSNEAAREIYEQLIAQTSDAPAVEEGQLSPIVQVGLLTSKSFHASVQAMAKEMSLSINDVCRDTISDGFPWLNDMSQLRSSANVRQIVFEGNATSQPSEGEDAKAQWVVRLPRELRARLLIFANEYKVSVPQICNFLIQRRLTTKEAGTAVVQGSDVEMLMG